MWRKAAATQVHKVCCTGRKYWRVMERASEEKWRDEKKASHQKSERVLCVQSAACESERVEQVRLPSLGVQKLVTV